MLSLISPAHLVFFNYCYIFWVQLDHSVIKSVKDLSTLWVRAGWVLSSFGLTFKIIRWKWDRPQAMKTTITEDSCTNRSRTQTFRGNTEWHLRHTVMRHRTLFMLTFGVGLIFLCINTHSDPDESPSTVPALMLMATPFSWSGMLGLAGPARLSLEEDPCGDALPGAFPQSSLLMRLRPFLSTIGESCFFFRIPAEGWKQDVMPSSWRKNDP